MMPKLTLCINSVSFESIPMEKPIQSVGVIGKYHKRGVQKTLSSLIAFLKKNNIRTVVEEETAAMLGPNTCKQVKRENLGSACELVIVVGGDGSLLNAAHAVVDHNTPVLGINRGRLGFLTDISPADLEHKLTKILAGEYYEEKRFLLDADIRFENEGLSSQSALNEIALLPGPIPHIIEFEIYIDDQFMCNERSDGLIIATPTGSTAYALSGGGPIVHPELNAIVIVPMFPHSLHSRPIVIDAEHDINIVILEDNDTIPRISCDSRGYTDITPGSLIHIRKKQEHLRIIHPLDYDYYDALRSKLHWGKKNYHDADED